MLIALKIVMVRYLLSYENDLTGTPLEVCDLTYGFRL